MNTRGRQFTRGGGGGGNDMPPRRSRFRGQYFRRRTPSSSGGVPNYRAGGSFSDDRNDSPPPPTIQSQHHQPPPHHHHHHHHPRANHDDQYGSSQHDPLPQQQYHSSSRIQHPRLPQHRSGLRQGERRSQQQHQQAPPMQSFQPPPSQSHESNIKSSQDLDEIRTLFSRLSTELEQVKTSVKELTVNLQLQQRQQSAALSVSASQQAKDADYDQRRKAKLTKQREKKAARVAEKRAHQEGHKKILSRERGTAEADEQPQGDTAIVSSVPQQKPTKPEFDRRIKRERDVDKRRIQRRNVRPIPSKSREITHDDSTTQAADPSSEDRPENEDSQEAIGKERVRVFRRKKQHLSRGDTYGTRRRRQADSSERNSNDTSPQDDAIGNDDARQKKSKPLKTYPELSEPELNEVIQALKREFLSVDKSIKSIRETMLAKGPVVVNEFASSILDHAICDVTSPRKLSEMANSLYQLLVSEESTDGVNFQDGFYNALTDVSKREDDIVIDAPRYMDTLGQVLAECIVPMITKQRKFVKKFLLKCLDSYSQRNRALLLASIMRALASVKDDRFAKNVWDLADLEWDKYLSKDTDLGGFLTAQDVQFTTRSFSPEPQRPERGPEELRKFVDDITAMVERRCSISELDMTVVDLDIQPNERVKFMGSLIFAVIRGCIFTESGEYKLNSEALSRHSTILTRKHEEQDAIALHALVELTKLWHSFNCPQDLLRTIIVALHNQGTASYSALKSWLDSENLNNIPGIGAARLNCKRYIDDLGAAQRNT